MPMSARLCSSLEDQCASRRVRKSVGKEGFVLSVRRSAVPVPSAWPKKALPDSRDGDPLSVWCPQRKNIHSGIERESGHRFATQVPDPDVLFLVADVERDPGTVRRNPRVQYARSGTGRAVSRPWRSTHDSPRTPPVHCILAGYMQIAHPAKRRIAQRPAPANTSVGLHQDSRDGGICLPDAINHRGWVASRHQAHRVEWDGEQRSRPNVNEMPG